MTLRELLEQIGLSEEFIQRMEEGLDE